MKKFHSFVHIFVNVFYNVRWKQSSETSLRRNHDHYQRTFSQTCRNGPISMRHGIMTMCRHSRNPEFYFGAQIQINLNQ